MITTTYISERASYLGWFCLVEEKDMEIVHDHGKLAVDILQGFAVGLQGIYKLWLRIKHFLG